MANLILQPKNNRKWRIIRTENKMFSNKIGKRDFLSDKNSQKLF